MANKVDVVLKHISDRFSDGFINVLQELDETQSLEKIHQIVRDSAMGMLKGELLPCNPRIEIVHKDGSSFLLNDKYLVKYRPFKMDASNTQEKTLKIYWNLIKSVQPNQSKSMYIKYIGQIRCSYRF